MIKGSPNLDLPSAQKKVGEQKDRFERIVEKSIFLDLKKAMDMEAFFDTISAHMAGPLQMQKAQIQGLLLDREAQATTVLAPGLAVPHIIVEGENKFSMLVCRCKKRILFEPDQPGVYAAFVLIGSRDERHSHLRAL